MSNDTTLKSLTYEGRLLDAFKVIIPVGFFSLLNNTNLINKLPIVRESITLQIILPLIGSSFIFLSFYFYSKHFFNKIKVGDLGNFSFESPLHNFWKLITVSILIGFTYSVFTSVIEQFFMGLYKAIFGLNLLSILIYLLVIAIAFLPLSILIFYIYKRVINHLKFNGEYLRYEMNLFSYLKNDFLSFLLSLTGFGIPYSVRIGWGTNYINAMYHTKYHFNFKPKYWATFFECINLFLLGITIVGLPFAFYSSIKWIIENTEVIEKNSSITNEFN